MSEGPDPRSPISEGPDARGYPHPHPGLGAAARTPVGDRGRVAAVHQQARATLLVALAFIVAAPLAAVLPHETGEWLPLHLFLVGGLLSAISGATQMLAVTWSSAPAPPFVLTALQRWLLAIGAFGLAVAREMDAGSVATAIAGMMVISALVLLVGLLLRIRAGSIIDRFKPAIDGYVVAIVLGILGTALGILLATGRANDYPKVRSVHIILNLLGLVGLIIAATLPYFIATQIRAQMSRHATPAAVRCVVITMAAAVAAAAASTLLGSRTGAAAALGGYALCVLALGAFMPSVSRRQFIWSGPRLVQLCSGIVWWVVSTGLLAASAASGHPMDDRALLALIVGGYGQILVASLAYFGPVLRGGGHIALTAGFALTRSWVSVVAGNVAAIAGLVGSYEALAVALAIWILDLGLRAVLLRRGPRPAGSLDA